MKRRLIFVCILQSILLFAEFKQKSILQSGNFYKISVSSTGIFKIDFNFLKSLGLNPTTINPNQIKIYGNGFGMLPQNISSFRYDDLQENAIKLYGTEDGRFDSSDYLLFFAQGPDILSFNKTNQTFEHIQNLYSDKTFYYLNIANDSGLRVLPSTQIPNSTVGSTLDYYDDFQYHEKEMENLLLMGRNWYGEKFVDGASRSFNFNFSGLIPNSNITLKVSNFNKAKSNNQSIMKVSINNFLALSQVLNGTLSEYSLGNLKNDILTFNSSNFDNNSQISINMNYTGEASGNSTGYLNFIEINAKRSLSLIGSSTIFQNIESSKIQTSEFLLKNANSTTEIWDVTTTTSPFLIQSTLNGNNLSFLSNSNSLIRKFIAFNPSQISSLPVFENKVTNQNIHGAETPHLLIVSYPPFIEEAKRLAAFKNRIGIKALAVTTDEIYNEFSSGAQDISAIRNCASMFYKRGGLKNVLLFGACSYDYKDRTPKNTNYVPVYEAVDSYNTTTSYCSDDFYGFFGDNEGDWPENGSGNYNLLIGVGRLPIRNIEEAAGAVNKIINYSKNINSFGKWRNKILLMADNGDGNGHLNDAEILTSVIESKTNLINLTKSYIDAYPMRLTPVGNTAPRVNSILRNNIENGVLIINYSGHGGPDVLASEKILSKTDAQTFNNFDRLNFYITATCDFGLCDQPLRVGGAVELVLSPKGGAIGIVSATRPVYKSTNLEINKQIYNNMFSIDTMGIRPDIGDVFRRAKNASAIGVFNRSYMLFADPSTKIALPEFNVVLTSINGMKTSADTLEALSKVTFEGEVRTHRKNQLIQDFNGVVEIDLFDKYSLLRTLGQSDSPVSFKTRDNSVLSAKASVKNGKFKYSFILPKDINYKVGESKVSLYAYDEKKLIDAGGYTSQVMLGGTNENAPEDNTPPQISLYMDDTTFVNKGLTGSKPLLIVKLADENGINIARSGIGHEITGVIDEKTSEKLILNENYSTELNDFTKGRVVYRLDSLSDGSHQITVKAWDTYNNSSEKKLDFIVTKSVKFAINQIINVPNPANEFTKFLISHNQAGEPLELQLNVYNQQGKLIKQFSENINYANATLEIDWNIKDNENYNISEGIYVYKCALISKKDNQTSESIQKLVIVK